MRTHQRRTFAPYSSDRLPKMPSRVPSISTASEIVTVTSSPCRMSGKLASISGITGQASLDNCPTALDPSQRSRDGVTGCEIKHSHDQVDLYHAPGIYVDADGAICKFRHGDR